MAAAKIITVFGATGKQGGSVAAALLKDPKYKVRAVTRNPDSDKSKALAAQGMEMVKGDLGDAASVRAAMEGAHGAFLITDYYSDMNMDREICQGKTAVDAAKDAGIQHLVFSGLESVNKAIGKVCEHFDSKSQIEDYIQEKGVPNTCVRYSFFAENFITAMKPQKNEAGEYMLAVPMGEIPMHIVPAEDCGQCVHAIFDAGEEYKGKKIGFSCDELKISDMASLLTKVTGSKFTAVPITTEMYAGLGFPGARELSVMFEFYQKPGGIDRDVQMTRKLHPGMPTFEQWATKYKDQFTA